VRYHLSPHDVRNILIPVPKLDIQKRIAKHASQIRSNAKRIKEEANAEFERARQEVEKIILGT
jgi:restriction endonuclease S subunit